MENLLQNRVKILAVLCLFIVGLGIAIFLLTPPYKNYSIHKTPYISSEFATIQGDSVYGYSGVSFYKSSLADPSKVTVLSSGFYLPVPKTINWAGDDGAVLTFTDQGATGSLLESELQSRGQEISEQSLESVWYFNFKEKTLELVDEVGFASPAYYYSSSKHGFYYIRYGKAVTESHGFENASLTFFSTKSLSSQAVAETVGNEEATTHIGPCKNVETVCLVKDLNGKYSLYAVENGKQEKIGKTYDHLVPTASPAVLIGSVHDETESSENTEDELLRSRYYLLDPSTGKDVQISKDRVANNSFISNTLGDDFFYIFEPTPEDPDKDVSLLSGAKNILKTPKTKQVKFSDIPKRNDTTSSIAIIEPESKNSAGYMLFRDVDASYLISPEGYDFVSAKLSSQKIETALKSCFDTNTEFHEYSEELSQFKVGITYDTNYRKNIEAFSSCAAATNPQSQVGQNYIFVGLSPIDGRFVTN